MPTAGVWEDRQRIHWSRCDDIQRLDHGYEHRECLHRVRCRWRRLSHAAAERRGHVNRSFITQNSRDDGRIDDVLPQRTGSLQRGELLLRWDDPSNARELMETQADDSRDGGLEFQREPLLMIQMR